MASAPLFYVDVMFWYNTALILIILVIEVAALINCVTRRKDAFPAVGNATKAMWVLMNAGAIAWTALIYLSPLGTWWAVLGVIISAIYLLDVRPAIRDALNGRGGW
jgi:hypothetical protein